MSAYHFPKPEILLVTNSSTTTPKRLVEDRLPIHHAILMPCKAKDRTANLGSVFIGPDGTAGEVPLEIQPYTSGWTLARTDLYDWFLEVGTADDGLLLIYW